jgi:hypothetical protein
MLDLARAMCPADPGRPLHAALRRCISTAYYAAFHALSDEIARPYQADVRPQAARLLAHSQAREVAEVLQSGNPLRWVVGQPACHSSLRTFGEDFVRLQLARERADYDRLYRPTKNDALIAIDRAERAIGNLATARAQCVDQLQATSIAMLAGSRLRKRLIH